MPTTISKCRDCGGPIVWLRTKGGKNVPVETDEVDDDDLVYDPHKHICHFDICTERK